MDGKDIGNYCYYIMARSKRGRPDGGEKKNEKNACPVYRISSEFGPGKALREHNTPAAVRLTYGRACIIFRLLNPRDELSVVRRGRFQFQMRVRKIQSPGTTARSPSPRRLYNSRVVVGLGNPVSKFALAPVRFSPLI